MKTYSILLAAGLGVMAALTSCVKDTSIPSYEDVQKESYTSSFVAKYGPISSTQSWDFTTGEHRLSTRGFSPSLIVLHLQIRHVAEVYTLFQ